MKTDNLNNNDIQVADLTSPEWDLPKRKNVLVYAPLAGLYFLTDKPSVEELENALSQPESRRDEAMASTLAQLTAKTVTEYQSRIIQHPSQFTHLSILPNLKCNFKCNYCYSSKGRSTAEITTEQLQSLLNWFIDAKRVDSKTLSIFISGGGEPLLSVDKLRFILEHGSTLAEKQGLDLLFILNTNGSLVTPEIVGMLKKHHVEVGVSFDILPDVQNAQRGQYDKVAENIRMMVSQGLVPSISTVITEKNVNRMMEMVNEIVERFPAIRHLNFDDAMDDEAFATAAQLDTFYSRFEHNFFEAKRECLQHGMTLDCNAIRHAQKLFARYCQGQLCMVPNGDISICHTVSSPEEKGYDDMIYGHVADGQISFDQTKFSALVDRNHFMHEECHSCIAKWHCSGGCMMFRRNYDNQKMQAVCHFTQRMTIRILLARLEQQRQQQRRSFSQLHKLTLLPTHRCNFKCTYCFSAKGRQNKTLSEKQAFAAIDYFIDRQRTPLTNLWLAILGGGEPFLEPHFTNRIIQYASSRAQQQGLHLSIGLTTNGSIYDAALSKTMIMNKVHLGVSFEVLKDIQNAQRQHYDEVVPVVRHYLSDGVDVCIKSIITPNNVNRLEEMVDELHRLFPQVKQYKLQIVEDPDNFADRDTMRRFYADFTANFFEAQEKGLHYGIDVYVLASLYAELNMDHYCGGEICVNPEGTITVCHRFSSPAEPQYDDIVYGSIDDEGNVRLDEGKFAQLMSHDISQPRCRDCTVKHHCGGGCLAQSKIYDDDQLDIVCDWTRSFIHKVHERRGY